MPKREKRKPRICETVGCESRSGLEQDPDTNEWYCQRCWEEFEEEQEAEGGDEDGEDGEEEEEGVEDGSEEEEEEQEEEQE